MFGVFFVAPLVNIVSLLVLRTRRDSSFPLTCLFCDTVVEDAPRLLELLSVLELLSSASLPRRLLPHRSDGLGSGLYKTVLECLVV